MIAALRPIAGPIVALMLFQICALVIRSFFELRFAADGTPYDVATYASYLVVPPILAVLCYPIWKSRLPELRAMFSLRGLSLKVSVQAILAGVLIYLFSRYGNLVQFAIDLKPGNPFAAHADWLTMLNGAPVAPLALGLGVSGVLTPIVEEIINRGLILPALLARGTISGIVIAALLFAILHPPPTFPMAFAFGVYAGLQFARSGHLWLPLVTHCSYNMLVVFDHHCNLPIFFPTRWTQTTDELLVLSACVAALALISSLLLLPRGKPGQNDAPDLPSTNLK